MKLSNRGDASTMAPESRRSIYAAIAANFLIAAAKFVVAWITGSSAILAEGIHSVVDCGDGLLLLIGLRKSTKPPDRTHPFGHGKELYFWTLIVAMVIFGVGGGMSVYEGILSLKNPHDVADPKWNYLVLGFAAVFEGASFVIAMRNFLAQKKAPSVWEEVRKSKDPSTFAVLLEDGAALIGLAIAFLGLFLGGLLSNPYLDGAASILIGILLAAVAVVLAGESKGLLIGESADAERVEEIQKLAESDPGVERVERPMTMYFGPHTVLLNMNIQFARDLSADEIARTVDRIEQAIRQRFPEIRYIFLEAESIRSGARTPEVRPNINRYSR